MITAGDSKEGRAGRYVMQPTGYRAFMPSPLPPEPPMDLGGHLRDLLSEADYALGRLDGAVLTLPNPDLFVFMYVRKEAVLSSQIEGTQSSLQNLLAAEARLNDPDAPSDVAEVVNYVRAMNHGLERLAEIPVSVRLIREIHSELMHGARGGRLTPGELRTTQNWIGPGGCSLREATFVPPPPQEVPQALSDLEHSCTSKTRHRRSSKSDSRTPSSRPSTRFWMATDALAACLSRSCSPRRNSLRGRCCICRTTSSCAAPSITSACRRYATPATGKAGSHFSCAASSK